MIIIFLTHQNIFQYLSVSTVLLSNPVSLLEFEMQAPASLHNQYLYFLVILLSQLSV